MFAVFAASVTARGQQDGDGSETFQFDRLNRSYEGFVQALLPIELGVAVVDLSSPEHVLTVHRHLATLEPAGNGQHHATLDLEFEGRGTIEAEIAIGHIRSHLDDELVVPRQRLKLEGRIELARTEQGYLITTRELDDDVEVEIESRLAGQLFSLCHQLVLVLVTMDCQALENALSRVRAPLPAAGESYLLPDEELSDDDRRTLDAYLTRSALSE